MTTGTIDIYTTDDLLKRAENIVYFLGYRGAVGDQVLNIYKLLKEYERLDNEGGRDENDKA